MRRPLSVARRRSIATPPRWSKLSAFARSFSSPLKTCRNLSGEETSVSIVDSATRSYCSNAASVGDFSSAERTPTHIASINETAALSRSASVLLRRPAISSILHEPIHSAFSDFGARRMPAGTISLLGLGRLAGLHGTLYGAYTDSPHESFVLRFSPQGSHVRARRCAGAAACCS